MDQTVKTRKASRGMSKAFQRAIHDAASNHVQSQMGAHAEGRSAVNLGDLIAKASELAPAVLKVFGFAANLVPSKYQPIANLIVQVAVEALQLEATDPAPVDPTPEPTPAAS